MLYLLAFITLVASSFCDQMAIAVTENDPSTLVEGVSVITGDLYLSEEDYVVQGAEPIPIQRHFLSRDGEFKNHHHRTAEFACLPNFFKVNEHNGIPILYYPDPQNKIFPSIGDNFYGEKKHRQNILKYNALTNDDRGYSNTKTGELSAKTNLKNQYILFDSSKDPEGKSFTLYASDGTQRRYAKMENQKKASSPFGTEYLLYSYKLISETLPNGHTILYNWDGKNQLRKIYTTNSAQSKIFASLEIPSLNPKKPSKIQTVKGSDELSLTFTSNTGWETIDKVITPDFPEQNYKWEKKKKGKEKSLKINYLTESYLPKNRKLSIEYDDTGERRVKTLSSPVGEDEKLITTHSFSYDAKNKNSYVLDVHGNKTAYFWDNNYRLSKVERYIGKDQFHSSDLFYWERSNLRSKVFLDKDSNPIFCRTYEYDGNGNVKEEAFFGNLSGEGCALKIVQDGLPEGNGAEKHVKKRAYSEDGRNLLILEEDPTTGLRIGYTYQDDCHLLKTKTIYDGNEPKIKYTYEYDDDRILESETVDDGIMRVIKKITPRQKMPYLGMPETIEERDGDGKLLKKIAFHYEAGARIKQKDIYDANDSLRYCLKMGYDEKGRLISETNALGQEAIYDYDEVGNLKYSRDFSGRLQIKYYYDFSNRLKKKEEIGNDGILRTYLYDYDTKHNLISEIDPYGNSTIYVTDTFGNCQETHLPKLTSEKGDLIDSVLKYEYDSAGNQIEKKDCEGNITQTSYNAYGKPIVVTHPDGATEENTYYLNGNLKTHTDPKGVETFYEYDYLGRVTKKRTASAEETYEYTGQFLTKKTDAENNATIYKYDLVGRKIYEECAGEETIFTYDEFGRIRITQKKDLIAVTEYDLLDRVIEERNESTTEELFRKVRYEYDLDGKQKTIFRYINGKEEKETFEYDSVNRIIAKSNALGFIETYAYDSKINQKTHTDAMGLQTIETYNAQNQIVSIEKRKGKTLSLEVKYYDKNGKQNLQINTVYSPNGESKAIRTTWEYNSRGQLKKLTEAEGTLDAKITLHEYYPRGELKKTTKPDGISLIYEYNDLGHLEALISSDGTVNYRMEYNKLGHLQKNGALRRKTDAYGRITDEMFPHGHTIQNTYDKRGRRDTCAIPRADCLITYEYEPTHLKTVTRRQLDETALYSHTYSSHDLSGNILEQELILNSGKITFSIDPLSRNTSLTSPYFTQEVLKYDSVGNIHKMLIGSEEINYTYDDLYQLTYESGMFAHTYEFDSLNNRLRKDDKQYNINSLNQITNEFKYDKNGNPKQHEGVTYSYDALDRLVRVETKEFTQTFEYDFLHRCLSKTITQGKNQKTLYFLYDGQNEIGCFDEKLNPIELRILGKTPHAEIGAAIAIELNKKIHIPIHDLQGNLAALKPIDLQPTFYRYSAFGEECIVGKAISPWGFSSKRTDRQTGLVNFGSRFYLPSFGRWLTPDPAGFTDGMNLYAFLHNDPLTHVDEYGLIMTARDYNTAQQISKTPWETPRPWNTVSYYGRNIASRFTHDLYDQYLSPIRREGDSYASLFSGNSHRAEQTIWNEKRGIDRFFGTNIARMSRPQFDLLNAGIPFGPGSLLTGTVRVSSAVRKVFNNPKALSPAIKLSSNAQKHLNLTRTSIKDYLREVRHLTREQITNDLKSIGLRIKGQSPDSRFIEFVDNNEILRVKIHPPDNVTSFDHLHIYDRTGRSLNRNLQTVNKRSPESHIQINDKHPGW